MKSPLLTAAALGLTLAAGPALAQESEQETEQQTEQETQQQSGQETADYGIETPLAEVDGQTVMLGDLIAIRRQLPQQYQQLPDQALFQGILEQLIDQTLLAEAAREAGIDERPAVAVQLRTQERAILADAYLAEQALERVSEEEIGTLYQERHVEGEPVEEVNAAHILVESEETAEELRAELDAGADFAELAEEHGTDGTASRGGELGWFTRDQMVPAFADKVFAMEPGSIAGPVETDFGYHLIKLNERRDRPAPPLEEVEGELRQELAQEARREVIEELRAGAEIAEPDSSVPPSAVRADELLETDR